MIAAVTATWRPVCALALLVINGVPITSRLQRTNLVIATHRVIPISIAALVVAASSVEATARGGGGLPNSAHILWWCQLPVNLLLLHSRQTLWILNITDVWSVNLWQLLR